MVALGLGIFAFAMLIAIAIGWKAANSSRDWDESKHINLIQASNGSGKRI